MDGDTSQRFLDLDTSPEILGPQSSVAVLDAGGQYVDLVQKAAQRLGYHANVLPLNTPVEDLQGKYGAIVISGSPANSQEIDAPMPDPNIWDSGMPILGICYGMQAMVSAHGGKVERGQARQDGRVTTSVNTSHTFFKDTKTEQTALFTHGNFVAEVPSDFTVIGQHVTEERTVIAAIAKDNMIGVQFHPEVFDDTPEGYQLFKNFFENIANLQADPSLVQDQTETLIERLRSEIHERVGNNHVIAFVSGGVDSSVATTLATTEVAPDKLHAYYIDNGFMRHEDEAVIDLLKHLGVAVTKVDAADYFSGATMEQDGEIVGPLVDVTDPQVKRRIIGKAFIDIQNRLVAELGLEEAMLLQGTNAADRIESGHSTGDTHTALIKTHHNQVKEVRDLKARGLLLEPLDELFKDEVRNLGHHLGLPDEVVNRHPFPGPGLAIRILCSNGRGSEFERLHAGVDVAIQSYVDQIAPGVKAVLLPIRNVGVGGDERSHVSAVALSADRPWGALHQLALNLPSLFRDHINRVVVAVGNDRLGELSITPTKLDETARTQLRHADRIVFEEMRTSGVIRTAKQVPVVLLPLSFGSEGQRSIVLRPVTTSTFMTVQAMIPGKDMRVEFVQSVSQRLLTEVPGISQVFLDLTGKPPGTTEWE